MPESYLPLPATRSGGGPLLMVPTNLAASWSGYPDDYDRACEPNDCVETDRGGLGWVWATLPEPPKDEFQLETNVFIPYTFGGTPNEFVSSADMSFTQGGEQTVLKGVSMSSGGSVDRRAHKVIRLMGEGLDETLCRNTHVGAQLSFDDAGLFVYQTKHEGVLATSTDIMASDGSPLPVPDILAPLNLQLKKLDEEQFAFEVAAPKEALDLSFEKPGGGKVYGLSGDSSWWTIGSSSSVLGTNWQDEVGDHTSGGTVGAGSTPFVIHYTYLEGLVAVPLDLRFPILAGHPDSAESTAIDAGDIVSATRFCELFQRGDAQSLSDESHLLLTVSVPLPPDATVVAWDSLHLKKAQLDSGGSLHLNRPIHSTTMVQRAWSGDDDFMGVARMHEGELLLDISVTPVCEPARLKKFMGSVDLLVSGRTSSVDILLEDGVTEWVDPEGGLYHLELEVEDREDIDLKVTGAAELLDFELLDSSGAPIEVDRQRASRRELSTSLSIYQKEALPEGAILRVTAHREVSRHTASFSAKGVPLP